MSDHLRQLLERFPEAIESHGKLHDKPLAYVRRDDLLPVAQACKALGYDHLACLTGVDHPGAGELEAIYNLYSYRERAHLVLKARCPRQEPRLPSVSSIWKSALFLEREAYDLVGIRFEGHPNLMRILLPEPWAGHPLRKDYDMSREQFVSKGPEGEDVVTFDPSQGW